MDPISQQLVMGAAGSGGSEKLYVEDVFSTWLYTGNGSTQTITNGIDLSGKGGLVWLKGRSGATGHRFVDTARGATKSLDSSSASPSAAEATESTGLTSFSSTGFSIGADTDYNTNVATYVSWTFRKAAKFFDVVTYTGNGTNRTIAHSLGSVPGCIIVKRTDTTGDWQVYHRSIANTEYLVLNSTAAKATGATRWNSTTPTSTEFSLGTDATVNASGGTYVAYLFAHDAGGFGASGNDSVIKCGSFTTDGSGNATVDLGWEPQWVLFKCSSSATNWNMSDSMRGMVTGGADAVLFPNNTNVENSSFDQIDLSATGFSVKGVTTSASFIYIAIRRGPMKTPTDATKVFDTRTLTQAYNTTTPAVASITTDLFITGIKNAPHDSWVSDRLRGAFQLITNTTGQEAGSNYYKFDVQTGVAFGVGLMNTNSVFQYFFRRAPGFFDVVAYKGNFTANRQINHSLAVKPQLIIVKARDSGSYGWGVYAEPITATKNLILNTDAGAVTSSNLWNNTEPTATVFTVDGPGGNNLVNGGWSYIAYLFASCPGVSKVGSYTGTGATLNIDCGFSNGARFVLIKRTDSTGDWYVWDTARGIVSGNDPYLLFNSVATEVTSTDFIDPLSSGFQISSTAPAAINASGGTYLYLAIA